MDMHVSSVTKQGLPIGQSQTEMSAVQSKQLIVWQLLHRLYRKEYGYPNENGALATPWSLHKQLSQTTGNALANENRPQTL